MIDLKILTLTVSPFSHTLMPKNLMDNSQFRLLLLQLNLIFIDFSRYLLMKFCHGFSGFKLEQGRPTYKLGITSDKMGLITRELDLKKDLDRAYVGWILC